MVLLELIVWCGEWTTETQCRIFIFKSYTWLYDSLVALNINTKCLVSLFAFIFLIEEFLLPTPFSFWHFHNRGLVGISVPKYCISNVFLKQFSKQKGRLRDLRPAIWVPKHSKETPLTSSGPPLLPIKAWQEQAIGWYILKLGAFIVKGLRLHKRSVHFI